MDIYEMNKPFFLKRYFTKLKKVLNMQDRQFHAMFLRL